MNYITIAKENVKNLIHDYFKNNNFPQINTDNVPLSPYIGGLHKTKQSCNITSKYELNKIYGKEIKNYGRI